MAVSPSSADNRWRRSEAISIIQYGMALPRLTSYMIDGFGTHDMRQGSIIDIIVTDTHMLEHMRETKYSAAMAMRTSCVAPCVGGVAPFFPRDLVITQSHLGPNEGLVQISSRCTEQKVEMFGPQTFQGIGIPSTPGRQSLSVVCTYAYYAFNLCQ